MNWLQSRTENSACAITCFATYAFRNLFLFVLLSFFHPEIISLLTQFSIYFFLSFLHIYIRLFGQQNSEGIVISLQQGYRIRSPPACLMWPASTFVNDVYTIIMTQSFWRLAVPLFFVRCTIKCVCVCHEETGRTWEDLKNWTAVSGRSFWSEQRPDLLWGPSIVRGKMAEV